MKHKSDDKKDATEERIAAQALKKAEEATDRLIADLRKDDKK